MLPRLFFTHFPETTRVAVDRTTGDRLGFLCGLDSQANREVAYIHFVGVDRSRTQVECVTSPVNTGSLAFRESLGFVGHEVSDYDGPGEDRVLLTNQLG